MTYNDEGNKSRADVLVTFFPIQIILPSVLMKNIYERHIHIMNLHINAWMEYLQTDFSFLINSRLGQYTKSKTTFQTRNSFVFVFETIDNFRSMLLMAMVSNIHLLLPPKMQLPIKMNNLSLVIWLLVSINASINNTCIFTWNQYEITTQTSYTEKV